MKKEYDKGFNEGSLKKGRFNEGLLNIEILGGLKKTQMKEACYI